MDEKRLTTFINSLNWQIPAELKELEKRALAEGVPVIRRPVQSLLAFLIQMKHPETILEIGTAIGFSGLLMLHYAGKKTSLDTIEKVSYRIQAAENNFKALHAEGKVTLYGRDASVVLEELVKMEKTYDFIFMDAAKGQYPGFLSPVLTLLSEEGILVTDNVLQNGDIIESRYAVTKRDRTIHKRMREYLYTLTHNEGLNTVILPVGDGVALTTKI